MAYEISPSEDNAKAVLYVSGGIKIDAPAEFVFDLFLNTGRWSDWNTFCPAAALIPEKAGSDVTEEVIKKGSKIAVQVRMTPTSGLRTQNMAVTELNREELRVCWKSEGMPEFLLRTMRTSQCVPLDAADGKAACEYRTYEAMNGPTAYVVKSMYGETLKDRFKDMANDLKAYAEKTWSSKHIGNE